MIRRVGFFHTAVANANMFRLMIAERLPEISSFHIVDESLIQDLLQVGQFTPLILRRFCSQVEMVEEGGAQLIMVTCSSMAPGVDIVRRMVSVPLVKVDEPMAEKAISLSDRIGLLATAKTTFEPSVKLIKDKAAEAGKQVSLYPILSSEAFAYFFRGDMTRHDSIVNAAAMELKSKVGVVVLAQASMSHLTKAIEKITGVPVLTSPPLAMEALAKKVKEV
jgi:Asp/Glu/hydantoin racemase